MRRRIRRAVTATTLLLTPLAACGEDEPAGPAVPGEPASLTLSTDTVRFVAVGAAHPLHATVSDANGIALGDVDVSWSSADEGVATVDGSGRVEAVGAGETEMAAEAGGASDAATVVVTQAATSVQVMQTLTELSAIGDSARLEAVVRDANGHVIEDAVAAWSSADTTVAAVDASGRVTARADGTTTVTASAGDVSDQSAVRVEQRVASVEVSPAADTVAEGATIQLDAVPVDANGVTVEGASVVWTTSDPGVASVDAAGRVTGTGWGADAVITATVDGVEGTAMVHALDQLAVTSDRTPPGDVYVTTVDGAASTNLTRTDAIDHDPDWSPDGSMIAFTSDRDNGDNDIYVMDADGSRVTRLTSDPAGDIDPVWSPDASKIAFDASRDGDEEIYVMNADGSDPTNLTEDAGDDLMPDWSPDGSMIAFTTDRDGDLEVYVMNADGSGQTNLTENASTDYNPAWSPDGERIAFVSGRDGDAEIYVMDADGSNVVRITDDPGLDTRPAWSPDGSRLAFASDRDGDYEIYVMSADGADGSGPTRVTDNGAIDIDPVWRPRP